MALHFALVDLCKTSRTLLQSYALWLPSSTSFASAERSHAIVLKTRESAWTPIGIESLAPAFSLPIVEALRCCPAADWASSGNIFFGRPDLAVEVGTKQVAKGEYFRRSSLVLLTLPAIHRSCLHSFSDRYAQVFGL